MAVEIGGLRGEILACRICEAHLPNPPRPLVAISNRARIVITGQAPGRLAHESGVPWNDPSGERLREWMGISDAAFYDPDKVALVPMGFCFPGTGKSGDLPPRRECAPQWHDRIGAVLHPRRLTLLVGTYAQNAKLPKEFGTTLEPRIRNSLASGSGLIALPHPSWRVVGWGKRNPWFEQEVLPQLRTRVADILSSIGDRT